MDRPALISIEDLKDRLLAQLDLLVHQLAPPAQGSYTKGGLYFTLNPGRADRSVGSFCIHMSGPKAGQWVDYAMSGREGHGDVLDLFGLSLGLSSPAACLKAAREWLGLATEDPAPRRAREDHSRKMRAEREAKAKRDDQAKAKARDIARAVWLSGQETILDTPVDAYLQSRGIDLRALPHAPRAIRFHPACRYYWQDDVIDEQTGEVLVDDHGRPRTVSRWRPMPAMLTAIARKGGIIDCHRTYLRETPEGWRKADLPDTKKVFTDYTGGSIRLCGETGPRGGHLKLAQAPQGSHVYIAEGIENALSLIALRAMTGRDPAFVIAAGAIWNMAQVELPETITRVTLAADNDSHKQAAEGLHHAIRTHQAKGREVHVWSSSVPGEDLNDRLKRALAEQAERGAA